MCIQKWELRYPWLLLALVSLFTTPVHLQDTCSSVTTSFCEADKGIKEKMDDQGACVSRECFNPGIYKMFKESKALLTPAMSRTGDSPQQVGKAFDLECMAWATTGKGLKRLQYQAVPVAPALAKLKTKDKITILQGTTIVAEVFLIAMEMTLTDEGHNQEVTCGMVFDGGSATAVEKARTAMDTMYAFVQSKPIIKGNLRTEAGKHEEWTCEVAQVTVDRQDNVKIEFTSNPDPPQSSGDLPEPVFKKLNSGHPLKFKVTQVFKLTVPLAFRPAFFLKCKATNMATGTELKTYSDPLKIKVGLEPTDLTFMFNAIGVCFGLGGFALGSALVIFYCRKKDAPKRNASK